MPHADFHELLLSDEVTRRENGSAARRARAAGLDPQMRLDSWDTTAAVRYDQQLWNEPTVARHRKHATIVTSDRTPDEWVTLMSDPLLAQSSVDRLASTSHELVVEGESSDEKRC